MDFSIWHTAFDVVMGAVLLHWVGRKLADLGRRDIIAVVWECLISEWRRSRLPQADDGQVADVTSRPWESGYPASS